MKKKNIPVEFVFQLFALIIAIIVVHAFYVAVVRPNAVQVIEEQNMMAEADPDFIRERSVWVLIKDFEQEACFGCWKSTWCLSPRACEYYRRTRASSRDRCRRCRMKARRCCCRASS